MEERNYKDEITLKELILKVQEYIAELLRNWWIIGLIAFLTTSYFVYKHYIHIPTYKAELRFVVEGQAGVGRGLGGLLGSIGFNKGGSVNPYKILEVGKSSKLFERVAFSSYDGDITIVDKIIDEYDLVDKWSEDNDNYLNFQFKNDKLNTSIERAAFKSLKGIVWGSSVNNKGALAQLSLDEEKGIYTMNTVTSDERLSVQMSNLFYTAIKEFFEHEIFENQKKSAEILAAKTDSINSLMKSKIYQLARFEDRNQGLVLHEVSSRKSVLTQEVQTLGIAYAELMKNYEMTDVNLKDLQPLFMEIDRPLVPIYPTKSSIVRNIILGLLLGAIIGGVIIILRKMFKEIML